MSFKFSPGTVGTTTSPDESSPVVVEHPVEHDSDTLSTKVVEDDCDAPRPKRRRLSTFASSDDFIVYGKVKKASRKSLLSDQEVREPLLSEQAPASHVADKSVTKVSYHVLICFTSPDSGFAALVSGRAREVPAGSGHVRDGLEQGEERVWCPVAAGGGGEL